MHLATNAAVLAPGQPGEQFQKQVERIHALGPLLLPAEILGIFLPLLFHSLLGVVIILSGKGNARYYRYGPNVRYTMQRISGVIALIFIGLHVWQMHWIGKPLGGGAFALHDAAGNPTGAVTTAAAMQAAWWYPWVYALGVIATVYHLANGIWTSLITWGITIKPRSQQVAGYVCAAFGVVVTVMGLGAVAGFSRFDVDAGGMAGREAVHTIRVAESE